MTKHESECLDDLMMLTLRDLNYWRERINKVGIEAAYDEIANEVDQLQTDRLIASSQVLTWL